MTARRPIADIAQVTGLSTALAKSIQSTVEIDLCRAPYNLVPGTDITSVLQAAIDALVVPGAAITFYFSVPGTYNISGAVRTGSVGGSSYAGQILLPGIPFGVGNPATVKFRGTAAPPHYYERGPGVILVSNATSGNAFSVIGTANVTYPGFSQILVGVENITLQLPQNPQCGGFDFRNAWGGICDQVRVIGGYVVDAMSLTGSGVGIGFTHDVVGAGPIIRNCDVSWVPYGVSLTDHSMLLGDNFFTACKVAITGHCAAPSYFERVYAMGCVTVIEPASPRLIVDGTLAWEPVGTTASQIINDPQGYLQGFLRIKLSGDSPTLHKSLGGVFGNTAWGSPINIANTVGDGLGYKAAHPVDTFLRIDDAPTAAAAIGMCSETFHPWRVASGAFTVTQAANNGELRSTVASGPAQVVVPVKRAAYGGETRAIAATVTLGSPTYDFRIDGQSCNGIGKYIELRLNATNMFLLVNTVEVGRYLATVAAGGTYTLTLAITVNHAGIPTRVRAFQDGVQKIDYHLSAAEMATFVPGTSYPYVEDGLKFYSDTGSYCTKFAVRPFTDDDIVTRSRTAAIAEASTVTPDATAGTWQTVTVADATAFTIAAPLNTPGVSLSQVLVIEVYNNSGGVMGAITWNAAFAFAGLTWTNPANTKKRYARFEWNGTKWVCTSVSAADY